MFHTTIPFCMNIVFIQSINANLLSIFSNIKRMSSFEFSCKICANCKVWFLLFFRDLFYIAIIDWAMDFVVSIGSHCNSSFKVSIFFEDSLNFLKANSLSPLNLCLLFPIALPETLGKVVACG